MGKESYSTANEGKRQFNRSIIYYLKIVPIVNDSFLKFKKKKLLQKVKKKLKGAAEARNPSQGSVQLVSNLGVIPLHHRA